MKEYELRNIITNIISEEIKKDKRFEVILQEFRKNCKQFIKYNNKKVYRGYWIEDSTNERNRGMNFIKYRYENKKRKPLDTDQTLDTLAEKFRQEISPDSVSRQKSVFATRSMGQAANYGLVYNFVPCDGYNFSYNEKVQDFTAYFSTIYSKINLDIYNMFKIFNTKFQNLNYKDIIQILESMRTFENFKKYSFIVNEKSNKVDYSDFEIYFPKIKQVINYLYKLEEYWENTKTLQKVVPDKIVELSFYCPNGYYLVDLDLYNKVVY